MTEENKETENPETETPEANDGTPPDGDGDTPPDGDGNTSPDGEQDAAPDQPEAEEAAADVDEPGDAEDAAAAEEGPDLGLLEAQVADLNDKLLRALAETENVRRRAEREKADALKYGITNFARDMLNVADNLRRALDHASEESGEGDTNGNGEQLKNLTVGIEMTEREMLNIFERVNIKPIAAEGALFDHNLHEAMFEIEDPEKPAGTVLQVIQTGYTIHGRLLRPAKVGVSKGGPKPETTPPQEDAATPDPEAKDKAAAYEQRAEVADDTSGGALDEEL